MDVISFQKIYGFCGQKGHIVEIRRGVTLVDDGQRTTECEDSASFLETQFAIILIILEKVVTLVYLVNLVINMTLVNMVNLVNLAILVILTILVNMVILIKLVKL